MLNQQASMTLISATCLSSKTLFYWCDWTSLTVRYSIQLLLEKCFCPKYLVKISTKFCDLQLFSVAVHEFSLLSLFFLSIQRLNQARNEAKWAKARSAIRWCQGARLRTLCTSPLQFFCVSFSSEINARKKGDVNSLQYKSKHQKRIPH